jgi:pimeloyl-ACP methyl ester carboxylesterase
MRLVLFAFALALIGSAALAAPPRWQTLPLPPAMPRPDATGFAESGDVKIYYQSFGKGAPVILLHGGLGNGDHWSHQVPELAKRYRVIVIDSRNQGRSGFSTAKLTYHGMAADVLAVMDALKLERAAIVGWSDGGAIALDLAIHHPTRVGKIFVYATNYDEKGSKKARQLSTWNQYAAKCKADLARLAPDKKYAAVVESLQPLWRSHGGFTKDQLRAIQAPAVIADGDHDEIVVEGEARGVSGHESLRSLAGPGELHPGDPGFSGPEVAFVTQVEPVPRRGYHRLRWGVSSWGSSACSRRAEIRRSVNRRCSSRCRPRT